MKQLSTQIMAILMAVVVLTTTMSFTVNMHYCGETLVDYSWTNHTKTCGMDAKQDQNSCENVMSKKSCCQDKSVTAKGHDDLKPAFHSLDFEQQIFVASFFFSYAALLAPEVEENTSFKAYSPPPLVRDVQKLDQVFRI